MPFDQIYWNNYGAGDFADPGYAEASDPSDVRFGVTSGASSHTTFSFYGKRRGKIGSFWNMFYRDVDFPYDSFSFGNGNGNNGIGDGGFWAAVDDPPLPTPGDGDDDNNCDEDKGWISSGLLGVCKPVREFQVSTVDSMVYSWPSVENLCYTNLDVNDMKKTGNGGNNISEVYEAPISDEALFQSQNRESCHNISNTARVKDATNTFIGIHSDYPLEVTTTKAMRGYYLILKRKRFAYNEFKSKHTKQYGGGSSSPHWQKGGWMRWSHIDTRQGNYLKLNISDSTDRNQPWTDQHEDEDEESTSDNITGIRVSPLGAPLSTARDYETHWTWSIVGYNWRAAGESGVSGRTLSDDLSGLFRNRVPHAGLLPLPWDNLDTEINAWWYDWAVATVSHALWVDYRDNGQVVVNSKTATYNALKTTSDGLFDDYEFLFDDSEDKEETYNDLLTTANAAFATATAETNTANTLFNAWTTVQDNLTIATQNRNLANQNRTTALQTFQAWAGLCLRYGPNGAQPINGVTDQISFIWVCGPTDVDTGIPNPATPGVNFFGSNLGWVATNGANYAAAQNQFNQADAIYQQWEAARLALVQQEAAAQAAYNAQVVVRDAAITASQNATAASDAALVEFEDAEALVDPAWDAYQAAQNLTDDAEDEMNLAILSLEQAQDKVDLYLAQKNAYPNNASDALKDKIANPIYYTDSRLNWRLPQYFDADGNPDVDLRLANPTGADHDGAALVQDAVIHPTFVPKERAETGSVYIKNITIKKNGTVLKAKDDVIGEFVEVLSSDIYTDQSGGIKATGAKDQQWVTFSKLYNDKVNIIHRYININFKIRFPGIGVYEIEQVEAAGNRIKLKTNLSGDITNSAFTLMVPRGSPDPDYTWGQYDLTEFDTDVYQEKVDKSQKHKIWDSGNSELKDMPKSYMQEGLTSAEQDVLMHVINDSSSIDVRDLFLATSTDGSRDTLDTLYASPTIGTQGGHLGKAARHPFFSNELSESLHIRNDFFQWAYYEYLYFGAPAGQNGHISAKVKGNVTWDKYKWVNWWEWNNTSIQMQTDANLQYADSGFTNLNESEFDGWSTSNTDLYGNQIDSHAKQFFYGGIDKASSAIWPAYENNIPTISPDNFNQSFSAHYTEWGDEFAEGYTNYNHSVRGINLGANQNNTPSMQRILDRPWFSYCAFSQSPGLITNFKSSLNQTTERTVIGFAMTARDINSTNNTERAAPWLSLQNAKYEKILKRPSVLAQYGFAGDMFGYTTDSAGFANNDWADHHFTIYESSESISAGTTFQVSLHQAGTEFNDDIRDEFERRVVDDNQVGDGRSKIAVDNYTLYVVAK